MRVGSSNEQLILKSALVLTVAGIISKILSAIYRIPFQNIAGDIGFYIYQQVYPFYGIALVLSTYGFPVIISKLVAEQLEDNSKKEGIRTIIVVSFVFLSVLCTVVFLSLYAGAERLANYMGDSELVIPLKVVAFSFLFVPTLSVLRGYFQGYNNMTPTAVSQVGEQTVRVTTILVFSYLLLTNGYSIYISSAGAVFGSITGGFCSIFILIHYFVKNRSNLDLVKKTNNVRISSSIVKVLIGQGFTICISSLFLILLQLVDAMTIYSNVVNSGLLSAIDGKVAKGIYDRGQPLIQLGTVVSTSLSLALVPLISSAKVRNDYTYIQEKVQLAIRVSVVFGLGAALGLIGIIKPTNVMLFENTNGFEVLSILAVTILFSSITMTTTAIIQGLDKSWLPAVFVVVGVVTKLILNTLLIPSFGTVGAAVATVIAFMVTTALNLNYLIKKLKFHFFGTQLFKTTLAGFVMILVLFGYQYLLNSIFQLNVEQRWTAAFEALSGVVVGGLVYIVIIYKTNVFSKSEIQALPFGKRLESKSRI
ncbi:putative polysaccharide biosynthesis protein [Bacillus sp. Marseille-P3661]|uniref:putative polysaccharide biosynthesis protein n=1 Tax=Bacillus sp. Marseille-P3661 TaxID=1936234 RepID=UPI000C847550|nr:polysaccharide biosynthesis protein [Bacillus sp. Marseille-P3661]